MVTSARDTVARLRTFDVLALTAALWFLAKFLRYALPPLFGTFRATYGVTNTELGVVFSALMTGYAAMQFPSGALADRVGTVRVVAALLALSTLALVGLLVAASLAAVAVATLLLGVALHGTRPARDAHLVALIPDDVAGGALGIVRTSMMAMGAVAPATVGYLSDVASFDVAFGVLGAALAASLVLVVVLVVVE